MLGKPGFNLRRFVRAVVIQHEMQIETLLRRPVDLAQEPQELLGPVTR